MNGKNPGALQHYPTCIYLSLLISYSAGADDGIEEIIAGGLILKCYQTVTGVKFVITAESKTTANLDQVLREIYVLYTSVLKDPFYELEMPIRSELFVEAVDALIEKANKAGPTTNSKR